jgi:arylsulfatase A-like enzyme
MKALLLYAPVPALYLGAYGNEAVHTPALDQLAASGIVFDAHESDGGTPEEFLSTLLTGRHAFGRRPEDTPVLLTLLDQAGVPTALLSTRQLTAAEEWAFAECLPEEAHATPLIEAATELLDRLVEHPDWLLVLELSRLAPGEWQVDEEETLAPGTREAEDILGDPNPELEEFPEAELDDMEIGLESAGDPTDQDELDDISEEASAEIVEDLTEEEMTDPEVQALLEGQAETAADVEEFDVFIRWLLGELQARDLDRELAIFFTGQGDSTRPDGLCSAGPSHPLRPALTRLPLIVRLPESQHAGRRIAALTQPADLTNSLLSWFGQELAPTQGGNLMPLCNGDDTILREYACAAAGASDPGALAITTTDWKCLRLTSEDGESGHWLFRLPEDRFGMLDLFKQHIDFAERLESCARNFLLAAREAGPLAAQSLPPYLAEEESDTAERNDP